jgi:hypothetical protein
LLNNQKIKDSTTPIIAAKIIPLRTFCSTKIRKPWTAITPYNSIVITPITGLGIVEIAAEILPINEIIIARMAAPLITQTE